MPRLLDLVREPYGGPYEECAVSTRVNSVRNDDPDTIAPRSEIGLFLRVGGNPLRGRDRPYGRPPAQIPASAANALGCLARPIEVELFQPLVFLLLVANVFTDHNLVETDRRNEVPPSPKNFPR